MSLKKINIVWIKRDIRSQDHEPFHASETEGIPYFPIYIFEPNIINYPDCSLRHLQFQYLSILQTNLSLAKFKKEIQIFNAEATEVFQFLSAEFDIQKVFSYQESGIALTYERDKSISQYLKSKNTQWIEFQRDGIIRGIKNRENWDKQWYVAMSKPLIRNLYAVQEELKENKKKLWDAKKSDVVKIENLRILEMHARKSKSKKSESPKGNATS